ncbi:tRNA (N(6)-L-threonylcarbamoyladenosine(37)-C(2))-methylthiotransferase MtaB, partial [Candidatus Aerophobetes bacterium]|nr:tRNA (N(6)-L-threonylcarbamoyladenosine(37)-C(2))-methylthiotransferase MtaB [Candidatus Aerophobetes bacterium]
MKKIAFATVGCKVNQYETQVMRERVERKGCRIVSFSSPADIYVINTCCVTAEADRKSLNLVKRALKQNPSARVVVTGCLVEAEKERIKEKFPSVFIIKNPDKLKIDMFIQKEGFSDFDFTIHRFSDHQRAFVKVEDGCDRFCTYCKIPYVRGSKIKSKSPDEVICEIKNLLDAGYREIVLVGVNLCLYGKDFNPPSSLTSLLEKILPLFEKKARLRLSSLEPHLIPDGLLEIMAGSGVICPHLHLAFQSADDRILERMGRGYTASYLREVVLRFKENIPQLGLTGDVIVGFPGEGEENFENTCRFVKEAGFHRLHIFTFSPREGTPAFSMTAQLDEKIKKRRSDILSGIIRENSKKFIEKFTGKILPVLIEGKKDKKTGCYTGYSHNYIKVFVLGEEETFFAGEIFPVRIKEA